MDYKLGIQIIACLIQDTSKICIIPVQGRDPTASSILAPHKSYNLITPMPGTWQNWNSVWRVLMRTILPPWPTRTTLVAQNWSRARCGRYKGTLTPVPRLSSNSSLTKASITGAATSRADSDDYLFSKFHYGRIKIIKKSVVWPNTYNMIFHNVCMTLCGCTVHSAFKYFFWIF